MVMEIPIENSNKQEKLAFILFVTKLVSFEM